MATDRSRLMENNNIKIIEGYAIRRKRPVSLKIEYASFGDNANFDLKDFRWSKLPKDAFIFFHIDVAKDFMLRQMSGYKDKNICNIIKIKRIIKTEISDNFLINKNLSQNRFQLMKIE